MSSNQPEKPRNEGEAPRRESTDASTEKLRAREKTGHATESDKEKGRNVERTYSHAGEEIQETGSTHKKGDVHDPENYEPRTSNPTIEEDAADGEGMSTVPGQGTTD